MITSFHLNTSELGQEFIEKLKKVFGNKKSILITVEEDDDPTWNLLSSEANRKKFSESINQLREGDLITVKIDDLKK